MTDEPTLRAGQLVRFEFANGSAIEGYVRIDDREPWLDFGIGQTARELWVRHPASILYGITPTILREAPRIPEPQGLGAVVRDADGTGWVRVVPGGEEIAWMEVCPIFDPHACRVEWQHIKDPVLLSEGWTDVDD